MYVRKKPLALNCRLCKKELRQHERPEGVCDVCLRQQQTGPFTNPPPADS